MGFKEFLLEYQGGGGAEAGKFEVVNTPLEKAEKLLHAMYHTNKLDPDRILPNFSRNYVMAQRLCGLGKTRRADMPVIRRSNVFMLQTRLARGALDVNAPFAKDTNPGNPFPQGLSGPQAQRFLTNGFRDGSLTDDKVEFRNTMKPAGELKPIQYQIYLDKALTFGIKFSPQGFTDMVGNSFMISSSDNYIIDGHHRWLFAVLANPSIKMATLEIDMPLAKLLKVLTAYGDAIGNRRNK